RGRAGNARYSMRCAQPSRRPRCRRRGRVRYRERPMRRVAFIVSHPIQYVVPLYQKLAFRDDLAIKGFVTWHAAEAAVADRGFGAHVAWDIPLTQGYEYERVPNVAADPGTHHFLGLRNPTLVTRIMAWRPDEVVVSGWAWWSHLQALYALHR